MIHGAKDEKIYMVRISMLGKMTMWPIHLADEVNIRSVGARKIDVDVLIVSSSYLNSFAHFWTKRCLKCTVFYPLTL